MSSFPGPGQLEAARDMLLQRLARYRQRKGHAITLVFDGWQAGSGSEHHEFQSGIEVIYSKRGERADQVIQRWRVSMETILPSCLRTMKWSMRRGRPGHLSSPHRNFAASCRNRPGTRRSWPSRNWMRVTESRSNGQKTKAEIRASYPRHSANGNSSSGNFKQPARVFASEASHVFDGQGGII